MGAVIGLFLAFIAGIVCIDMGLSNPDFSLGSRIFAAVCGLILMAPGAMIAGSMVKTRLGEKKNKENDPEIEEEKTTGTKSGLIADLKELIFVRKEVVKEDAGELQKRITRFRDDYKNYFMQKEIRENDPIQGDASQVFFNLLTLQKKRLKEKNLTMELRAERIRYGENPCFVAGSFFDGKYSITEIKETIKANQVFLRNGRELKKIKNTRIARYRLLEAKQVGQDEIICPGCGNPANRSNLLDGCDYCGTRFTIEDLGSRVSEFEFLPDYELEYNLYREARARFLLWSGIVVGVPVLLISMVGMLRAAFTGAYGLGPLSLISISILGAAFCTFGAVILISPLVLFFLFPTAQILASATHGTKKRMDESRKVRDADRSIVETIRKNDPLFSSAGFYAAALNKLSTCFYGDTENELLAFAESSNAIREILSRRNEYKDVIHMEPDAICMSGYRVLNGNAQIDTQVGLTLWQEKNGKIGKMKKQVKVRFEKNADCHTQAVCGPALFRCKGCGASIPLTEGKICSYCGRKRNLIDTDWVITDIQL